jgi:hypothetical protein
MITIGQLRAVRLYGRVVVPIVAIEQLLGAGTPDAIAG